jgi:tripartite-type tricarboxylate transporter receptor subunit TctC
VEDGNFEIRRTTATRSEALPDIAAVGDFLPGYEASAWWGIGVPKNTPTEIIDKLNKEINAALADPKMKARPPVRKQIAARSRSNAGRCRSRR